RALDLDDSASADNIINFLVKYIQTLRGDNTADPLTMIEALTTLGMLHRVRGQYYQWLAASNDEEIFPCIFYFHRKSLTQKGTDKGYFTKAETQLREALKLCVDKLGIEHSQVVLIQNEIGLLHRDRGEYKEEGSSRCPGMSLQRSNSAVSRHN